ncbi:MAG: hypothetical protein KDD01_01540 [Phaeodactylibacter sp.]|nr:hypothetical protein [Phaeodactylibacter sp.]
MKKVCLYTLASLFCLALIPAPATAQSSRTAAETFLQEVFSRKQQEGGVVVSRKKTESKKAPQQEEPTTTTREGRTPSRKSGGYKNPQERREGGGYEENQGRNRQGGYGGRGQERDDHRQGRNNDSCNNGQHRAHQGQYSDKGGKSKCGVRNCSHPGKHKGLHKN